MTKAWIGGVALAALALAGCKKVGDTVPAPAASELVKGIHALASCAPTGNDIAGVINIVVPDDFTGNKINRSVFTLKQKNPPKKDPKPNPTGSKPNKPTATGEPFDVFLDADAGFGPSDTGFILVQVMLPNGKKNDPHWVFHETKGFEGVGVTDKSPAGALCGGAKIDHVVSTDPNPPAADARQIASFYIDLSKFDWKNLGFEIPFVIGIELPAYPDSPFFIDPKVRNGDGGGGIRTNSVTTPQGTQQGPNG